MILERPPYAPAKSHPPPREQPPQYTLIPNRTVQQPPMTTSESHVAKGHNTIPNVSPPAHERVTASTKPPMFKISASAWSDAPHPTELKGGRQLSVIFELVDFVLKRGITCKPALWLSGYWCQFKARLGTALYKICMFFLCCFSLTVSEYCELKDSKLPLGLSAYI